MDITATLAILCNLSVQQLRQLQTQKNAPRYNFSYHHLQIVILIDSVSDIYHFSHISYLIITKILFEDHRRMICKSLNRSENEPQKAFFSILRVIILSI